MVSYELLLSSGRKIEIDIDELAPTTLETLADPENQTFKKDHLPAWSRLEFNKCSNCTLKSSQNSHCPAAVSLKDIIGQFSQIPSTETTRMRVKIAAKVIEKSVDIQTALRVVFGLKMSLSGCPILGQFKMLGKLHLPFADMEETVLRTISMMVINRLREQRGESIEFKLSELEAFYRDVGTVNKDFLKRIRAVVEEDSNLNALVILNSFSQYAGFCVRDLVDKIK